LMLKGWSKSRATRKCKRESKALFAGLCPGAGTSNGGGLKQKRGSSHKRIWTASRVTGCSEVTQPWVELLS